MNTDRIFQTLLLLLLLVPVHRATAQSPAGGGAGAYGFARVDGAGLVAGMGGIGGATRTNLAQTASTVARNFFVAGGVNLQPGPVTGGGVAAPVVAAVISSHQPARAPTYRERLVVEAGRLGAVIAANQRARRASTAEIVRITTIEAELRRLDRQVAGR